MTLALDIETVPTAASLARPYPAGERNPPANYKLPDAIKEWREKDKLKWEHDRISDLSLNPRTCRVLCVGTQDVHEGTKAMLYAEKEHEEKAMLEAFWSLPKEGTRLVTWNGTWDIRVLVLRSIALGVPIPMTVNVRSLLKRYETSAHFDCKAVLLNWPSGFPQGEGLTQWAEFFGLAGKTPGLDGDDVYPLYVAGHHDEIRQYCGDDVTAIAGIYNRISGVFG